MKTCANCKSSFEPHHIAQKTCSKCSILAAMKRLHMPLEALIDEDNLRHAMLIHARRKAGYVMDACSDVYHSSSEIYYYLRIFTYTGILPFLKKNQKAQYAKYPSTDGPQIERADMHISNAILSRARSAYETIQYNHI